MAKVKANSKATSPKTKPSPTEAAALKAKDSNKTETTGKVEVVIPKRLPVESKPLSVEDLLTKLNGFEGAVSEVKHLKMKATANPDNALLARELKNKLQNVNTVLKSIAKVII